VPKISPQKKALRTLKEYQANGSKTTKKTQ
jgi:hypothetical protein